MKRNFSIARFVAATSWHKFFATVHSSLPLSIFPSRSFLFVPNGLELDLPHKPRCSNRLSAECCKFDCARCTRNLWSHRDFVAIESACRVKVVCFWVAQNDTFSSVTTSLQSKLSQFGFGSEFSSAFAKKTLLNCRTKSNSDRKCTFGILAADIAAVRQHTFSKQKLAQKRNATKISTKSGHPESNQGPSDCCMNLQSDALPTELWPVWGQCFLITPKRFVKKRMQHMSNAALSDGSWLPCKQTQNFANQWTESFVRSFYFYLEQGLCNSAQLIALFHLSITFIFCSCREVKWSWAWPPPQIEGWSVIEHNYKQNSWHRIVHSKFVKPQISSRQCPRASSRLSAFGWPKTILFLEMRQVCKDKLSQFRSEVNLAWPLRRTPSIRGP